MELTEKFNPFYKAMRTKGSYFEERDGMTKSKTDTTLGFTSQLDLPVKPNTHSLLESNRWSNLNHI